MANCYKKQFDDYIADKDLNRFFVEETLAINGATKSVRRCVPTQELLELCKSLAVEKAKYTMDEDQSGNARPEGIKESKQFEGVLAETYCQIWLKMVLPECDVLRFDLERADFAYSSAEYDIIAKRGTAQCEFEIRNSYSYKTTLQTAYAQYDILGAYVNWNKKQEELSDFYIRPLFQCVPPNTSLNKPPRFVSVDELISRIMDGEIVPYLCCGADKEELIANGYESSFGQGRTKYLAIKMMRTVDMNGCERKLKMLFLS